MTDKLDCLSDVQVAERKLFLIQGDKPQLMNWEKFGLRIGVQEASLSSTDTVEAAVVALVGGQFQFPPNTVLVSAVYAVSLSKPLLKRLILEIQHCVDLTGRPALSRHLKFAIAPVSTPSLPYQFSIVEGGEFSSNSWYGSIQRKEFCLVCILGLIMVTMASISGQEDHEGGGDGGGGGQSQQQQGAAIQQQPAAGGGGGALTTVSVSQPAAVQQEGGQSAAVQQEGGQPAAVQQEGGQPAAVQQEGGQPAAVQQGGQSVAVQQEGGQPAAVQQEGGQSAAVQQEGGQPAAVQQQGGQPAAVQQQGGQPAAVQQQGGQSAAVQQQGGQPAAVQQQGGQPAAVQQEGGQPAAVQQQGGQPAAVQQEGGQPAVVQQEGDRVPEWEGQQNPAQEETAVAILCTESSSNYTNSKHCTH